MKNKFNFYSMLFIIAFQFSNFAQTGELEKWMEAQPEIEFKKIKGDSLFAEVYEIFIQQPVDHFGNEETKFKQQLFLSVRDKSLPMVFYMEGYGTSNRTLELSRILNCNQIIVEHRYFDQSVPENPDWNFMTIPQAAADHHNIVRLFKKYFEGKWISTGISKGGSTAIFHKKYYPDDADVSVPYVAPLNYSYADRRMERFLENVSTPECREKVKSFQRAVLKRRDELLPMFESETLKDSLTFLIGIEKAFEYTVLEYGFAFWQLSKGDCNSIPDSNDANEKLLAHLKARSPFDYFSDASIASLAPFFHQAYTEFGYYEYDVAQFKDLLKFADGATSFFIPKTVTKEFDAALLFEVEEWLMNEGNNFIYIYGGNDPWTAAAINVSPKTNSLKMIKKNGSHGTRISSFEPEEKELILSTLEKWLGYKINR